MKRREFIKGAAVAAGAAALGGEFLEAEEKRPNVLLIIVDQWRAPRWFPKDADLPGFNRLKKEGVSFTNFFTSAVPCSPSRATMFTGLHITQHGVQSNVNAGMNAALDPKLPTLAQVMQKAGYRTPYFGKWHLTERNVTRREKLDAYGFTDWVPPDHHGVPYDGMMHDAMFANQSIRWLRQNGKRGPFFLTCSLINPHDICFYRSLDAPPLLVPDVFDKLPDNFDDDLSTKPRIQTVYRDAYGKLNRTTPDQPKPVWLQYLDFYYYLQRKVDAQIARLLAELDRLGLAKNTIVIFTADHGEMCGSHKLQAKGPFIYQENNNVPLIVRAPGLAQPGSTAAALSHNPDLFPTIVGLAGVSANTGYMPGKSLVPALQDPAVANLHDHALMAMGMGLPAAGQRGHGSGFVAALIKAAGVNAQGVPAHLRAIHDGRHKFARYFGEGAQEEYELYDLIEDPLEMRNLAGDQAYAALKKEMADQLKEAEEKEMAAIPREFLK